MSILPTGTAGDNDPQRNSLPNNEIGNGTSGTSAPPAAPDSADSPSFASRYPLSKRHLDDLRKSGLTDGTIEKCTFLTLRESSDIKTALHWKKYGGSLGECLAIPFVDAEGKLVKWSRLKPDNPRKKNGKVVKYETPCGTTNLAFFPPKTLACLKDPSQPLIVTEGEKKAAKADQEGFPCIGLVGVYGWQKKRKRGSGEREMIDGLAPVVWQGRQVFVCYDSDAAENRNVLQAERLLSEALEERGASVKVVRLPAGPPGPNGKPPKVGLDDYLVAHGPEAFRDLLSRAKPPSQAGQEPKLLEADNDPHRLAQLVLAQTAKREGNVWRFWRGEWHHWDGAAYRRTDETEFRATVTRLVREEFVRLNLAAQEDCGDEIPKALKVTSGLIRDVTQALQSLCLVPGEVEQPAWLDAAKEQAPYPAEEVLACKNSLVHLPGLVAGNVESSLRPPTPLFFSSAALDYSFDPHAPAPDCWLAFLDQIWPNDQEAKTALQEWMGYLLTHNTRHHKIGLLIGPPRAGKGVVARVVTNVIGKANVSNPSLADLSSRFGLWGLIGKSLAIIPDARLSGKTDQGAVLERLLNISGEDGVLVDRKNLPPLEIRLKCRLMIVTNELPRLHDESNALADRLLIFRFTKSFKGQEDPDLTEKLLAESPGILNWAIEGWSKLHEPGGRFTVPASSLELLNDFCELTGHVKPFVWECCLLADNASVLRADLFAAWQEWCRQRNQKPGDRGAFGRDLRAALPNLSDSQRREGGEKVRKYVGICLAPEGKKLLEDHNKALAAKKAWENL
jgi:putative DNA primase/helicase